MHYRIIPDANAFAEAMEISKQHNVSFEYNDFWHPEVYEDASKIDELISLYKASGRDLSKDTMHGAFLGLDLAALDPVLKYRSRLLLSKSMEIANRLGVGGVVFHTGLIGGLELDYYLEHFYEEATSFWSEQCRKYPNITVYIENSFEKSPEIFVELLNRMKDVQNFKVCFDYAHAILTPTDIEKWVSELAPFIGHMHINDNDLVNDLHQVPGEGKIDFSKWKKLMEKYEIDCSVLIEINGNDRIEKALNYMSTIS